MIFLNVFLVCGCLCLIAQLVMDIFKLLPIHLTVLYVSLGSLFEIFNIYDKFIDFGGAGALLPISSFGHSLTHAALEATKNSGYLGILTGIFDLTSSGIAGAIFISFILALIFKPRG